MHLVNQKILLKSVATVLKLFCAFAFIGSVIIGCLALQHSPWHAGEFVCMWNSLEEIVLLYEA